MDLEGRGAAAVSAEVLNGGGRSAVPDPEVSSKATRRRFSAVYKAGVLDEIDRDPERTGAILRREGLYSSHVSSWRKQRRAGTLQALGKQRGKKAKRAAEIEVEKLRRENARLQDELERAQVIIDAQKKLAEILGVDLPKIVGRDDESK
jgi:hypothetical protein